jgi:hypothetical protein
VKNKVVGLLANVPQEFEVVFDMLEYINTEKNIEMAIVAPDIT